MVRHFGNGRILGGQSCDSRMFEHYQAPSTHDLSPLMGMQERESGG